MEENHENMYVINKFQSSVLSLLSTPKSKPTLTWLQSVNSCVINVINIALTCDICTYSKHDDQWVYFTESKVWKVRRQHRKGLRTLTSGPRDGPVGWSRHWCDSVFVTFRPPDKNYREKTIEPFRPFYIPVKIFNNALGWCALGLFRSEGRIITYKFFI